MIGGDDWAATPGGKGALFRSEGLQRSGATGLADKGEARSASRHRSLERRGEAERRGGVYEGVNLKEYSHVL
eukprot:8979082-Pyramimonas_sp.AAC.1